MILLSRKHLAEKRVKKDKNLMTKALILWRLSVRKVSSKKFKSLNKETTLAKATYEWP